MKVVRKKRIRVQGLVSAQVNGFAASYERSGDTAKLAAVRNFFDIITSSHSYATGGNNDGEFWQAPHELGTVVTDVRRCVSF